MDLKILDSAPGGVQHPIYVRDAIRSGLPLEKGRVYITDSDNQGVKTLLKRGRLQYVGDRVHQPGVFLDVLDKVVKTVPPIAEVLKTPERKVIKHGNSRNKVKRHTVA